MSVIPIPERLLANPVHMGYPVPWIALRGADGTPDFRVIDEERRARAMKERLCQLCGGPMGKTLFFVGGPGCITHMAFFEPPVHLDCLIYAMQVCPFILGKLDHVEPDKVQARHEGHVTVCLDPTIDPHRCETWVIVKCGSFTLLRTPASIQMRPQDIRMVQHSLRPNEMTPEQWQEVRQQLFHAP
jgi:hypothetical protein